MGKVEPPGGARGLGGQNRFPKNIVFERFAAKSFSEVNELLQRSKMDCVNLICNAFLKNFHRNFSSMYIMVPCGHEGLV